MPTPGGGSYAIRCWAAAGAPSRAATAAVVKGERIGLVGGGGGGTIGRPPRGGHVPREPRWAAAHAELARTRDLRSGPRAGVRDGEGRSHAERDGERPVLALVLEHASQEKDGEVAQRAFDALRLRFADQPSS